MRMDFRFWWNFGRGTCWEVVGLRLQSLAPSQIVLVVSWMKSEGEEYGERVVTYEEFDRGLFRGWDHGWQD
jgi:hypothetical protein